MSKEIDAILKDAFYEEASGKWSIYELYDKCQKALKTAIKSGEDFDTTFFGCASNMMGAVERVGNTFTCFADYRGNYTVTSIELPFKVTRKDSPQEIYNMVIKHLKAASQMAEEESSYNVRIAEVLISKNGKRVDEYVVQIDGDEIGIPPTPKYQRWGFQREAGGDEEEIGMVMQIPHEVQKSIKSFAEDLELHEDAVIDKKGNVHLKIKHKGDNWEAVAVEPARVWRTTKFGKNKVVKTTV